MGIRNSYLITPKTGLRTREKSEGIYENRSYQVTENIFYKPYNEVAREQMAAILYRCAR